MPHRQSSSSSPVLTPPLLIILLPILFLIFLFFTLPPFLSLTSQIFKPSYSVKKTWDSFNIFLVLFAILCGIFARLNDDEKTTSTEENTKNHVSDQNIDPAKEVEEHGLLNSQQWSFGFPERKRFDPVRLSTPVTGTTRLRRSSSSYPDLRQESLWEIDDDRKNVFRFFDDFDIEKYKPLDSPENSTKRGISSHSLDADEIKVMPVDTFVLCSSPAKLSACRTPATTQRKPRRTYRTIRRNENEDQKSNETKDDEFTTNIQTPPPNPPPPPPSPPPFCPSPARVRPDPKNGKNGRKKINMKKEIRMVFASIYNQSKRKKKQKRKSFHDDDSSSSTPETTNSHTRQPPIPPPPPPPLPPNNSLFHSLFKKSGKSKKVHSVSVPLPKPPPPPPRPKLLQQRNSTNVSHGRPPLPTRVVNFYERDENYNSGGQSPLIPIPPPPPLFKMPEMKFVVRGDFVRIRSTHSSRCSSPELEDVDQLSSKEILEKVCVMDGGYGLGPVGSVFCPSPDVNVKADSFIARLKDGWRLEKMNSVRENQRMVRGPGTKTMEGPSPSALGK